MLHKISKMINIINNLDKKGFYKTADDLTNIMQRFATESDITSVPGYSQVMNNPQLTNLFNNQITPMPGQSFNGNVGGPESPLVMPKAVNSDGSPMTSEQYQQMILNWQSGPQYSNWSNSINKNQIYNQYYTYYKGLYDRAQTPEEKQKIESSYRAFYEMANGLHDGQNVPGVSSNNNLQNTNQNYSTIDSTDGPVPVL